MTDEAPRCGQPDCPSPWHVCGECFRLECERDMARCRAAIDRQVAAAMERRTFRYQIRRLANWIRGKRAKRRTA